MNTGSAKEEHGNKIQGDKLEHAPEGEHKPAGTPAPSALDQLEIPPHEKPQTDGGTKLHGDKLESREGKS